MTRTWETQKSAWGAVPVDDVGYIPATDLVQLKGSEIKTMIAEMERRRYQGWRNHGNLWWDGMGHGRVHGNVLDYGCGTGMEALQYARAGNKVSIADINRSSVYLTETVLGLHEQRAADTYVIQEQPPFIDAPDEHFDLIAMNGVLHHIEHPVPVVEQMARWLRPGGELRVMVYTDKGWSVATGTAPPEDVTSHPERVRFVRWGDAVGDWADWYNGDRLEQRFGQWFDLVSWTYITVWGWYGIGVLRKR